MVFSILYAVATISVVNRKTGIRKKDSNWEVPPQLCCGVRRRRLTNK
jgi:hypothetical protein